MSNHLAIFKMHSISRTKTTEYSTMKYHEVGRTSIRVAAFFEKKTHAATNSPCRIHPETGKTIRISGGVVTTISSSSFDPMCGR